MITVGQLKKQIVNLSDSNNVVVFNCEGGKFIRIEIDSISVSFNPFIQEDQLELHINGE